MSDQFGNLIEYDREQQPTILQFLLAYKLPVLFISLGLFLGSAAFFTYRVGLLEKDEPLEVISNTQKTASVQEVLVEVSGEVKNPGVVALPEGSRIDDAIEMAGGFTKEADSNYTSKNINLAAKIVDGQKIYIPKLLEQSITASANQERGGGVQGGTTTDNTYSVININTARLSDLESLWGIGPSVGQNIIDQRPYSTINELIERKIVKKNVFEQIKDKITAY